MLFKTNTKYEDKLAKALWGNNGDCHYPIFEVVLNVGIFHCMVSINKDDYFSFLRFITSKIRYTLSFTEDTNVESFSLFYQFPFDCDDPSISFKIFEIDRVESTKNGLELSFVNGKKHLHKHSEDLELGILYNQRRK